MNATPVADVSPLLPNTIWTTLAAVPRSSGTPFARRYTWARGVFQESKTARDRSKELLAGVLREVAAGALAVDRLEAAHELREVVRREIDVALRSALLLQAGQLLLESVRVDPFDDLAVHLDEPPVGVVGEAVDFRRSCRAPPRLDAFRPRLRIVSIIPGIEIAAPERTETSSGSCRIAEALPDLRSRGGRRAPRSRPRARPGSLPPARMYWTHASVVTANPAGTGMPRAVISREPGALPPEQLAADPGRAAVAVDVSRHRASCDSTRPHRSTVGTEPSRRAAGRRFNRRRRHDEEDSAGADPAVLLAAVALAVVVAL